ncbi:MAG: hypothetical protein DWQ08_14280 [Proteobacteria bacterium]|nr:MAG: hypothetical protein DWQ08_14280 [Pseudomonadota bacterium]
MLRCCCGAPFHCRFAAVSVESLDSIEIEFDIPSAPVAGYDSKRPGTPNCDMGERVTLKTIDGQSETLVVDRDRKLRVVSTNWQTAKTWTAGTLLLVTQKAEDRLFALTVENLASGERVRAMWVRAA